MIDWKSLVLKLWISLVLPMYLYEGVVIGLRFFINSLPNANLFGHSTFGYALLFLIILIVNVLLCFHLNMGKNWATFGAKLVIIIGCLVGVFLDAVYMKTSLKLDWSVDSLFVLRLIFFITANYWCFSRISNLRAQSGMSAHK